MLSALIVWTVVTGLGGCISMGYSPDYNMGISSTVYSVLDDLEDPGYGLYSYALFPVKSERASVFLKDMIQSTGFAGEEQIPRNSLNIIYLPIKEDEYEHPDGTLLRMVSLRPVWIPEFTDEQYDYATARAMLARVCAYPTDTLRALCASDLSQGGPYLFTYAQPASNLVQLPPPYLFFDLSTVPAKAFPEFIAAYKAQVKRVDYTDGERLATFRLNVLRILTTAAEQVGPVADAVAHIFHLIKDEK